MFTKPEIFETRNYKVVSYGNRTAYLLTRQSDNRAVAFQGDDAITFGASLDAAYEVGCSAIDRLCSDYNDLMD